MDEANICNCLDGRAPESLYLHGSLFCFLGLGPLLGYFGSFFHKIGLESNGVTRLETDSFRELFHGINILRHLIQPRDTVVVAGSVF
jgi:hypothetical protein